ncbi:hypothetical protein [Paraburkholderia solitsugae]|nr:hypothetical protein [Paraburkholderia solitsugae]
MSRIATTSSRVIALLINMAILILAAAVFHAKTRTSCPVPGREP